MYKFRTYGAEKKYIKMFLFTNIQDQLGTVNQFASAVTGILIQINRNKHDWSIGIYFLLQNCVQFTNNILLFYFIKILDFQFMYISLIRPIDLERKRGSKPDGPLPHTLCPRYTLKRPISSVLLKGLIHTFFFKVT